MGKSSKCALFLFKLLSFCYETFLFPSFALLFLVACQPAEKGTIKIGVIGPLTGNIANVGSDVLNGIKLAVDEINATGGIAGQQVQLIAEDGRCTGADAASAAQKLIHVDRVVAIVGAMCSGETLAAAPIAEAASVPMLSPGSSSPDVMEAGDFIFRNYPNDALKTKALANYMDSKGHETIAIVSSNSDFSVAFRESLITHIGEDAVVISESAEQDEKDFRAIVTKLKDVEFDLLFPNISSDAGVAVFMQQAREQGITQQAVGHDYADTPAVAEIGGEAVEGLHAINVPFIEEGIEFEQNLIAAYGEPQASSTWSAYGYDAANVLFRAVAEVGTEGTAIRDFLYNMILHEGIVGDFRFDDNGDVLGIPYVLKEFQNGESVKIEDITVD